MKVSLKELRSGVCSHIDFDYTIDLSKEEVNFEFPFEKPVRFSGSISDMAGVLNLTADIDAQATGHCARCGKPVEYSKNGCNLRKVDAQIFARAFATLTILPSI